LQALRDDVEEEEWAQRQSRTGTVGRLVVYNDGDSPEDEG